jgi:hypothetical protein
MLPTAIPRSEPDTLSAGDSIWFEKFFGSYLPQDGWQLEYVIRGDVGGQPISFASTPNNDYHLLTVPEATTATWVPGPYVLQGFAVNAANNWRHEIYYGEFTIYPNGQGPDTAPVTTHAQRMIPLLEASLEQLAVMTVENSNVEQQELQRVKRKDLEDQLARNKEIRANEVGHENIRSGRPSGNKIVSQFNIVNISSARAVNSTGNLIP